MKKPKFRIWDHMKNPGADVLLWEYAISPGLSNRILFKFPDTEQGKADAEKKLAELNKKG